MRAARRRGRACDPQRDPLRRLAMIHSLSSGTVPRVATTHASAAHRLCRCCAAASRGPGEAPHVWQLRGSSVLEQGEHEALLSVFAGTAPRRPLLGRGRLRSCACPHVATWSVVVPATPAVQPTSDDFRGSLRRRAVLARTSTPSDPMPLSCLIWHASLRRRGEVCGAPAPSTPCDIAMCSNALVWRSPSFHDKEVQRTGAFCSSLRTSGSDSADGGVAKRGGRSRMSMTAGST